MFDFTNFMNGFRSKRKKYVYKCDDLAGGVFGKYENEFVRILGCQGVECEEDAIKYFEGRIQDWKNSDMRKEQLTGQRYYEGNHDIKNAERTAIGTGGGITVIDNLPNNRIMDNQYAKTVDQKINYILGNPLVINTENKVYANALNQVCGKQFFKELKAVCSDSINCGCGWMCISYDKDGNIVFKRFRSWEILPISIKHNFEDPDFIIRVYNKAVYSGNIRKIVEKAIIYTTFGIWHFTLDRGKLIPDEKCYTAYMHCNGTGYNWNRIPVIAFKYNSDSIPLIRYCKEIQDCINTMLSDFANRLQEDCRNTILVLKNYDGTDLGEFRKNLATYGAVKVRCSEGAQGGVETLNISVNADNYKAILSELRKALTENARGFDSRDDRITGSANQMNIQSIYSEMDLDGNGMEIEFQSSFDRLLWFVDAHIKNIGGEDFSDDDVMVTFNRNILLNEGDVIENIKNSVGIVSNETLLAHHPYVNNVNFEINAMKKIDENSHL